MRHYKLIRGFYATIPLYNIQSRYVVYIIIPTYSYVYKYYYPLQYYNSPLTFVFIHETEVSLVVAAWIDYGVFGLALFM